MLEAVSDLGDGFESDLPKTWWGGTAASEYAAIFLFG